MIFEYAAPKLTKYGKITEFIQAGSTVIATGDVTGDGVSDTLFDTDGDGVGDLVVGGANGGQTPVTFVGQAFSTDLYDADRDGLGGVGSIGSTVFAANTFELAAASIETGANDGWDNPDRD